MRKNVICLCFVLMLTTNCKVTSSEPQGTQQPMGQKVVFHYSYENFAWGRQQQGWYIDSQGNVWKLKEIHHWSAEQMNILEGEHKIIYYDADRLNQDYEDGREFIITTIDAETLAHYFQLIEAAATGEYSEPEQIGADQGSTLYGCLWYDEETSRYRKIILSVSGDWNFRNVDHHATEVDTWLKQIQQEYFEQQ